MREWTAALLFLLCAALGAVPARAAENSTEITLEIPEKARLDVYYVQHMCFGLDVKCFFGTISSALRHEGVVEGGTGAMHGEEQKEHINE